MNNNVHDLKRPLKSLSPGVCARLQKEMRAACRKIAEKNGLCVADDDLHDTNPHIGFSYTIRLAIPRADGSAPEPEKDMFETFAPRYGLDPADFGRKFVHRGERFRITGIEPRRPGYPVNVQRLSDRQNYKFCADVIATHLARMHHPK